MNRAAWPRPRPGPRPGLGHILLIGGSLASAASAFLAWTWTPSFAGDLTVYGYPGGNQLVTLAVALLTALFAAGAAGLPGLRRISPGGFTRPLRGLALALAVSTWYVLIAIAAELGGVANWEAGSWVAGVAVLLPVAGAWLLPRDQREDRRDPPSWPGLARIPSVVVLFTALPAGLLLLDYGLAASTGELFVGFSLAAGLAAWGLGSSGLFQRIARIAAANRTATALAAMASGLLFLVIQVNDIYTATADNILVFAAAALGLNIVVGLAGLLDLGYVAFLGVGAYAAALLSGSEYSRLAHQPEPFWAAALIGVAVAMIFGVVIGAPTLRLRGDYLAIVTLGFGEIFRITVNNLDGTSGPAVTGGPNGIPSVPDLSIAGYDFGAPHRVLGLPLDRFSDYYLLLLAVIAIVVFVFHRVDDSRIGRAWAAIREDEVAAQAMGLNSFRLKLLAFALGASLAGLAGTVQAHLTSVVSPDQYQFSGTAPPNSAFLLAAVVLGGMGTITGPLLGAALLYLIPEKLAFFQDKQLLLFGLTLIVMMRLRPEGLVPSRARRLELHGQEG